MNLEKGLIMRVKGFLPIVLAVAMLIGNGDMVSAQTATPPIVPTSTPYPLPAANVLLIYDTTSLALINISQVPLSLVGMSFMRGGGVVKYNVTELASSLAPGHCIQWWIANVTQVLGKTAECSVRDRYTRLTKDTTYFWVPEYIGQPFRPQLNTSAVYVCNTSAGRCTFTLPQGDTAKKSWTILDPVSGVPLPAGIQVAYDANQLWIGNMMPDTVLTTAALRVFYTVNGKGIVWTPSDVIWDGINTWDGRALLPGQCIVMYQDYQQSDAAAALSADCTNA